MHPAPFEYHRPTTVADAVALLGSVADSRPLAGGHSLLPIMKQRLAAPAALVDLGRIGELSGISDTGATLRIGATTTHAAVASSDLAAAKVPVLADTAKLIGDHQVRNRGTIGGSIAHADPAADYPPVLVALGATVNVTGPGGDRSIAAGDFFTGLFETALAAGELVTSVDVPVAAPGSGAAYVKHRHPASSYAVVGVVAVVEGGGGRLVVGGATATPVVVPGTDPAAISAAISDPIGDLYASGEYRVHLATVLAKQAIEEASERAA